MKLDSRQIFLWKLWDPDLKTELNSDVWKHGNISNKDVCDFLSNTSLLFSFRHNPPPGQARSAPFSVTFTVHSLSDWTNHQYRCTCCMEPTDKRLYIRCQESYEGVISNLKWSFGKTGFENWLYPRKAMMCS